MNYKELKIEILKMKEKGQLVNDIEISKAVKVLDGEKFIDSIILTLDHQQKKYKESKIFVRCLVKPKMDLLNNYYIEAKKVLQN